MSRVLNLVITHASPADVAWSLTIWSAVAPPEQLLIAYGGSQTDFDAIAHANRVFVSDPRLRTRDHQRERQSFSAVFRAAVEWMKGKPFTHVYCAEFDHLPLVRDLHEHLVDRLEAESADVLGHELQRVDGTNSAPYLNHVVDPRFADSWRKISVRQNKNVILNMFGSGTFWTRAAFERVAAHDEPCPIYLEIWLPTLAHHLGYRVRPFLDQDQFIASVGDRRDEIEAARAAGSWTIHPVKSHVPVEILLPPQPGARPRPRPSEPQNQPFLSICIPTYARSGPLGQVLESIASQVTDEVEVLVAEDPSDEDATAVIERMRALIPGLQYSRNPERLKFDLNLLRLLGRARGDYCWLLSDDDIVEPGAVKSVLGGLRQYGPVTGATVNRNNYDSTLTERIYGRPFRQQETRIFHGADEMFIGLLDQIGLLSCQIFRRDLCLRVTASPEVQSFVGSGYVQLYVMMRMMALDPSWLFLADKCIGWRADNDSFAERGHLGRLRMDMEGYERVAAAIFSRDSATYRHAIAEVARSHVRHHIVRAKLGGASWAYSRDALALCVRHYGTFPSFWFKTFPLLLMPRAGVRLSRSAYQRIKQFLGR